MHTTNRLVCIRFAVIACSIPHNWVAGLMPGWSGSPPPIPLLGHFTKKFTSAAFACAQQVVKNQVLPSTEHVLPCHLPWSHSGQVAWNWESFCSRSSAWWVAGKGRCFSSWHEGFTAEGSSQNPEFGSGVHWDRIGKLLSQLASPSFRITSNGI